MTLRLSDQQNEALRMQADAEGRSMQQVILAALDEYIARRSSDKEVHRLGVEAVRRWKPVLDRLAE